MEYGRSYVNVVSRYDETRVDCTLRQINQKDDVYKSYNNNSENIIIIIITIIILLLLLLSIQNPLNLISKKNDHDEPQSCLPMESKLDCIRSYLVLIPYVQQTIRQRQEFQVCSSWLVIRLWVVILTQYCYTSDCRP